MSPHMAAWDSPPLRLTLLLTLGLGGLLTGCPGKRRPPPWAMDLQDQAMPEPPGPPAEAPQVDYAALLDESARDLARLEDLLAAFEEAPQDHAKWAAMISVLDQAERKGGLVKEHLELHDRDLAGQWTLRDGDSVLVLRVTDDGRTVEGAVEETQDPPRATPTLSFQLQRDPVSAELAGTAQRGAPGDPRPCDWIQVRRDGDGWLKIVEVEGQQRRELEVEFTSALADLFDVYDILESASYLRDEIVRREPPGH
jgi:hypothetical protein